MFKSKINKVLKLINIVVLIFIAVIFIFALSPLLPIQHAPKTYAVVSGSMEPTIKTGSLTFTSYVDPSELKPGDIVVFTSPSNNKDVILHRITNIKSTDPLRFTTKGDANVSEDSWDLMDVGVLGKYYFSIPFVGYLTAFIRKPLGFVILIVVPAVYLIFLQIINLKKNISDEIDKRVAERMRQDFDRSKKIITILILLSSLFSIFSINSVSSQFKDKIIVSGLKLIMSSDTALYPEEECEKRNNDNNNGKEVENTNRCKDKEKNKNDEDDDKRSAGISQLEQDNKKSVETTPSATELETEHKNEPEENINVATIESSGSISN